MQHFIDNKGGIWELPDYATTSQTLPVGTSSTTAKDGTVEVPNTTINQVTTIEEKFGRTLTAINDSEYKALFAPSLETVKAMQISTIEKSYQEALTADIDYMNTTFQADSKSLDLITQVLSVGSVPEGFYWRDKTNNDVAMTYAEFQGLASSIQSRLLGYFTKYQKLKTQINNAATAEDVKAIIWS